MSNSSNTVGKSEPVRCWGPHEKYLVKHLRVMELQTVWEIPLAHEGSST